MLSKQVKKYHFSLLEVLLCLVLISSILGGLGFKVHQMIAEEGFKKEAEILKERIYLAKDFSSLLGNDITLLFSQEKDGLHCYFTSSSPASDVEQALLYKTLILKKVEAFAFKENKRKRLKVLITGKGQMLPHGSLQLFMKNSSKQFLLSLK